MHLVSFQGVRSTGTYRKDRKGHNLLVLFDDLDTDTKTHIGKLARSHGVAPPREILDAHRNDFVDWRYVWEGSASLNIRLLDLDKVLDVLVAAYLQRDAHSLGT